MAYFQSAATRPHVHSAADRCPTCDQEIPNDRVAEVAERFAARARQAEADAAARVKAEIDRLKSDAAAAVEAAKAEAAARETAARADGEKQAIAAFDLKFKEATAAREQAERMLADMRETMEKARIDAVNAEQSKNAAERLKLEAMVADLQRKLQNKSVEELGEGAEVDLFEALKSEFPTDLITRVGRGNAGADVIHEIRHNGAVCGRVVYDSKNHLQWRSDHATKLREDQIAAGAVHAVLSTRAFPKDRRQLAIEHGVIIANPARAVVVAMLLRQQVVQLHTLRVSNEQRASKVEELYALMTSDRFGQFLSGIERAAGQLEALQSQEKKAHEAVWKKQGEVYRSLARTCAEFDEAIARIVGTAASGPSP